MSENENHWGAKLFGVYPQEGFMSECIGLFPTRAEAEKLANDPDRGCEYFVLPTLVDAIIADDSETDSWLEKP